MPGSSRSLRHAARGLVVFLIPATTGELRGQDIELLGEIHGTRPPPAYYRQLRDDPNAFRFTLEGEERLDRLRAGMRARARFGPGARSVPAARQGLGPREEAVVGAFHFPLVLGLFSDGPGAPAFSRAAIQAEFFDGPNSLGQTIPEFFGELSGGLVEMVGETSDWQTTELTREEVTLGGGGLVASRTGGIGAFIEAVLKRVDAPGVDWSRFDQSGDGFVDLLTVIHPGRGAECDGATNRIWSHRWSLSSVTGGRLPDGFRTSTPRLDGQGYIHVDDYTVQPLLACDGEWISEIGTFAHELGHGFGLPDLYRTATGAFVPGAGNWDLMSTGGWGCGGTTPEHPCHMGAWTKAALGWVAVEIVEPGTDGVVALEAVERASGRVLKLPARDGSNEYLLLENRQRIGADRTLPEPGLLIWHVDEDILDRSWRSNGVNNNPDRQGVWLRAGGWEGRTHGEESGAWGRRGPVSRVHQAVTSRLRRPLRTVWDESGISCRQTTRGPHAPGRAIRGNAHGDRARRRCAARCPVSAEHRVVDDHRRGGAGRRARGARGLRARRRAAGEYPDRLPLRALPAP